MPILDNPRHEKFAQAIFAGLLESHAGNGRYSQSAAYRKAGYTANSDNAAYANASRLIRFDKVMARVRELQAELNAKLEKKNRFTIEKISERIALASQIAEEDRNPSALYGAEKAIAEVRGLLTTKLEINSNTDFSHVQSMTEIGRKLLQQVGLREPDDVSIQQAIEANDQLIAALEAIRDRAQGLTLEHDAH